MKVRRLAVGVITASLLTIAAAGVGSAQSPVPSVGSAQSPAPSGGAWTWTRMAAPAGDAQALVLDAGPGPAGDFVVLARPGLNDTSTGLAWRTPDGLTLTTGKVDAKEGATGLVTLGDGLLAYNGKRLWRTGDGAKWKPVKTKLKGSLTEIAASPTGLLAIGRPKDVYATDVLILASADGKKWNTKATLPVPQGATEPSPDRIAVSPDGVAVVGGPDRMGTPFLWTSADQETWQAVPLPSALSDRTVEVRGLQPTPSGLLLVLSEDMQERSSFWTSTDGVAWTQAGGVDSFVQAVGRFPSGALVAVARDLVLTSDDGTTWQEVAVPELAGDTVVAVTGTADGRIAIAHHAPDDFVSSVTVGVPATTSEPAPSLTPGVSAAPSAGGGIVGRWRLTTSNQSLPAWPVVATFGADGSVVVEYDCPHKGKTPPTYTGTYTIDGDQVARSGSTVAGSCKKSADTEAVSMLAFALAAATGPGTWSVVSDVLTIEGPGGSFTFELVPAA